MVKVGGSKKNAKERKQGIFRNFAETGEYAICVIGLGDGRPEGCT